MNMLPKSRRRELGTRIDKALARSGSEMDYPKLAGMVGGQIGIRDVPPIIFHPDFKDAPFGKMLKKVFRDYRENLGDHQRVLLDAYRVVDAAIKVVGIGSVGRRCWIVLLMSATNDPLFLQFKEATQSVLEPYAGKSIYSHHGQRVIAGQRLMQPSSDIFLGWVTVPLQGKKERHYYARQLRDAKIKPLIETFDADVLGLYGKMCGITLARAHAKQLRHYMISGYLGTCDQFEEAMADFAVSYADQVEHDFAALKAAVKNGKITAFREA
jgi:hypothetical protein